MVSAESKLLSANARADGWKYHSDKMRRGKEVAQAHAKFFHAVIAEAKVEIEKPFTDDESLVERLRRVTVILDRQPPIIKLPKASS